MTFIVAFSFSDRSFLEPFIKELSDQGKISTLEYSTNQSWQPLTDVTQIPSLAFDQLKVGTNPYGTIVIQVINNSLPRIYGTEFDQEAAQDFCEWMERSFPQWAIYGRVCEAIDDILQNSERIDSWRRKKRALPSSAYIYPNPLHTNERESEIISLESMPGHYHQMDYAEKLWFGSCWKMYFSAVYFKYIPKSLFNDFTDCFENKVLDNGIRKITLFEDPLRFDHPENRLKQWKFRRAVGIDSIAHELTKSSNRIEPKNLPVLITKKDSTTGQTKVTRHLDAAGNLAYSAPGLIVETKQYLDDGVTVILGYNVTQY